MHDDKFTDQAYTFPSFWTDNSYTAGVSSTVRKQKHGKNNLINTPSQGRTLESTHAHSTTPHSDINESDIPDALMGQYHDYLNSLNNVATNGQ